MVLSSRPGPYERRRHRPILAVVSALAVLATLTWTVVLISTAESSGAASCPTPSTGPAPGEVLAADSLDQVAPALVGAVRVRVLNAGGQRGQANLVSAQLSDLGFTEATPPANDPSYPDGDMDCVGQLRFGPAGEAAATTLSLVLPCTELVRDGRGDAIVDIAVGTGFGDVNPTRAARDALDELADPTTGGDGSTNAADADPNAAPAPPPLDRELRDAARDIAC
ncbi:MAG: envelope integrity protein Cei [Pseudonocardia sp.]